jgi:hypothetical protein
MPAALAVGARGAAGTAVDIGFSSVVQTVEATVARAQIREQRIVDRDRVTREPSR